ncbi:MAG: hypothetical protein JWN31_2229 [Frankiales bacterium]|nr:hypothetical protein [Frankiales bacterium]
MSRTRLVADLQAVFGVVAGSVLLGAPAGLLWSAISPRVHVIVSAQGLDAGDLESDKAFIGADGTYFLLMLVMGLLCGLLAWWLFRRSGPVTVLALVVGGCAAALIAAAVGLMPGAQAAVDAVSEGSTFRGHIDLYLGRLHPDESITLRSTWACLAWPAGACIAFLAAALRRPQDLDVAPAAPLGPT